LALDSHPTPLCTGKVYLVGAGPGDPELLTVKAHKLLERADLVLHDDLVTAPILSIPGPQARIFNVGKRCGAKVITQVEINSRMIEGARRGLQVIRLKGGDPSIFGRLAEELDALTIASVPFEVVPGVTAASAAAAALCVSLTDRTKSSKVVIVSGHQARSGAKHETTDWRAVASHDATLVVYMPGRDLGGLRSALLSAGMPPDMPAVIVSHSTMPGQRHLLTTLGRIERLPAFESPAVLLIGWPLERAAHPAKEKSAAAALQQAEVLLSSL
jgi:uroporphyrin-III C-methyltransferase